MLLIFHHDYIDCTTCILYMFLFYCFVCLCVRATGLKSTSSTSSSTIAAVWWTTSNANGTESVRHIKLIREIWLSASLQPFFYFFLLFFLLRLYSQLAFCVRNKVLNKLTTDVVCGCDLLHIHFSCPFRFVLAT